VKVKARKIPKDIKKILLERRLQLPGDDIRPVDMFEEWMSLQGEQRSSSFLKYQSI
jgi:hypothetical protein